MNLETHKNEDLNKPENRTNLALFGILMIPEIHSFICNKLSLPLDSIFYPSPNLAVEDSTTTMRPDFRIESGIDGKELGYIEVELGRESKDQLNNYRSIVTSQIFSIVGKESYLANGGDLSLEETYKKAKAQLRKYRSTQQYASLSHFCNLVEHYIINGTYYATPKRATISDVMRKSKLIQMIYAYFGEENILENQKIERGKILLNTVSKNGFSLRLYCTESVNREFSVMARSGGRQEIEFPSKAKLVKYFPANKEVVIEYANLISKLGAYEIDSLSERRRAKLPLRIVENNFENFANIIVRII